MIPVLGGGGPDSASSKISPVAANLLAPQGECQPKYKTQNSTLIPSQAMKILLTPWLVINILQANLDEGSRVTTSWMIRVQVAAVWSKFRPCHFSMYY